MKQYQNGLKLINLNCNSAAAKVGGIDANSKYQADFILENLKIQTNVIESAWSISNRLLFLEVAVFILSLRINLLVKMNYYQAN